MNNLNIKDLKINLTKNPKQKPDSKNLGFGKYFSDHMFIVDWNEEKGWFNPRIEEYAPIPMTPAMATLHYGQSVFEGMKAYIAKNKVVLFRPQENFKRLNKSAERLALPKIDEKFALDALSELLKIEKDWIPTAEGTSLYIRPFMFATDEYLGVKSSSNVKFIIILSPSGAYFKDGLQPNKIFVEKEYVRAVRGGTGYAKASGNYAGSLLGQKKATKFGYAQTLWLDGVEQKYVEEVGAMNIFFKIDGKFVTPELNGSILPGITRDSIINLIKHNGDFIEERKISIKEIYKANKEGKLEEVFGTGTAAVISPVGELFDGNEKIVINNFETGNYSKKLYEQLTGIQLGKVEDSFNWIYEVEK